MVKEASFGIIPLSKRQNDWYVLLVQSVRGHWGFPKGHSNPGESSYQTAARELQEETGLNVIRFLSQEPIQEHYQFRQAGQFIEKTVSYFIAEVDGDLQIQTTEVAAAKWVPFSQAQDAITFLEAKVVCQKAQEKIT